MEVIKRDKSRVPFDASKIEKAILKAMRYGSGMVDEKIAHEIASEIEQWHTNNGAKAIDITRIEGQVFEKLIDKGAVLTAKAYEGYRKVREFQREENTIDKEIYGIVKQTNKEAMDENSNKDATVLATQRDLIAGEFSRDYCRRMMLPTKIVQAHDDGIIHFHDMDYFIQKMFNCCLVNLKDMFANGTVINGKLIETPKSLQTAATIATQIVQQVACGQYGGQTISLAHLSPFVRVSYNKHKKAVEKEGHEIGISYSDEQIEKIAQSRLNDEIKAAVQTIQYQINTFSTTNGQAPFLSIFMYLNEEPEYTKETAMLIEEVLKQRYVGMKNPVGAYVTPAFPKLLYVLDENNVPDDSEYRYLTDLAVKCVSKRMMPDFISAKIMKQNYEGQVFGPMGCRSFLSPFKDENGEYKWYGRFNQGVVTLNLTDVGLSARGNLNAFWKILDERLELCYEALMLRHENLKGTISDVSPIHWQYGAIARLKPGETIDALLDSRYSTISLGYIGLYECVEALLGTSHTSREGDELGTAIMKRLREAVDTWKAETGLGFALYGTPAESTTYKFARTLKRRFGIVPGVTDKDYITNSYHVNVREHIDAFSKLGFEAKFQNISSGGAISYVEVTNMTNNFEAMKELINYMYDTIQYAEINTKSDYCQECGFDGEILLDENGEWYCPNCGNRNHKTLNVCRRTCGYLGDNFWNKGRTQEIGERFVHLDNRVYKGDSAN
ncbi:MAG: anaerobic ribonucleoside-triphosphate reductase [Intestinibaculum porci]|uniref:anaerobic ribonucleoside-triphosphate reductase n=1 Tax=Intestinibaculum porci TaxID=2487118 RepID=UPI003EFE74BE